MKRKYDVIIVGAGPAGLKCAERLKNSLFSVLLIEKNKIVGPKLCGGGLTSLSSNLDIPPNKTRSFDIQQTYLNDKRYDVYFVAPLRTISRFDLGQHQLKKIETSENITIMLNTKVTSIKKNKIMTNKGEFYYKYLVGADGSSSIVRRHLGLESEYCAGFCYEIPKVTDEFIWVFNPSQYKSGYVWLFPHLKTTNVGIYYNPKLVSAKDAKRHLIQYLKKLGYNISDSELRGASVNYRYSGIVFDNIFLVGDAAGLCSKIWGEGIPHAITSGNEVGNILLNPKHKMHALKKILKIKKRQERIGFLFESMPFVQDLMIKFFVKLIGGSWFQYYFGIATSDIDVKTETQDIDTPQNKTKPIFVKKWVKW
jgi:geranylgeranyl reductase